MAETEPTQILVGDHLGQVKRILLSSNEISTLADCATPSSLNPVVSIVPLKSSSKQLIANKNGELYIYDPASDGTSSYGTVDDNLITAIPLENLVLAIHDKRVTLNGDEFTKIKKGECKSAKVSENKLCLVGQNIPLRVFDIETKAKLFDADPPGKDWLGIAPEVFVSGLDFVFDTKVATCSKSDSVIRVFDPNQKPKPVIEANLNQTAFNEHAEAGRFVSIASDGGRTVVAGSNVGQIIGLDLRIYKKNSKHKISGSFKGARGATIKDMKIASMDSSLKIMSCCLDRYLRVHTSKENLGSSSRMRKLESHYYIKTKPYCCSVIS